MMMACDWHPYVDEGEIWQQITPIVHIVVSNFTNSSIKHVFSVVQT